MTPSPFGRDACDARARLRMRTLVMLALLSGALAATCPARAQDRQGHAPSTHAADLIQRGRELFEDQRYEESVQTLSGALVRPNTTREQKIETYRLLALDQITLRENEEAESFVRALLALDPLYEMPKTESPRFRDFFAAVKTKWEAEGRPGLITDTSNAPKAVVLRHQSPADAKPQAGIVLTAKVEDPDGRVKTVKVFFRGGSKGKFAEETMQYDAMQGSVRGIFPASSVRPPFVTYYLLAQDKNGLPVASTGDADAPLRIPVPEEEKKWILPVAIGGGIVGVAGIVVGTLALSGAFK